MEYIGAHSIPGPIPARAGKPGSRLPSPWPPRAYPRSRGGTDHKADQHIDASGLSPLARGKQNIPNRTKQPVGPIPARAGEPGSRLPSPWPPRAYPRSRGGTFVGHALLFAAKGLSPLARGNPRRITRTIFLTGPIPARAGEPYPCVSDGASIRAYPRSRGGTGCSSCLQLTATGLSPLARGNRGGCALSPFGMGPIPARAGEPAWPGLMRCGAGAYPRSRGGTV